MCAASCTFSSPFVLFLQLFLKKKKKHKITGSWSWAECWVNSCWVAAVCSWCSTAPGCPWWLPLDGPSWREPLPWGHAGRRGAEAPAAWAPAGPRRVASARTRPPTPARSHPAGRRWEWAAAPRPAGGLKQSSRHSMSSFSQGGGSINHQSLSHD